MHRKLIALTAVTASLMVPAASFAQSSTAPQGSTSAASSTARVGNHPKIDFAAIAKELGLDTTVVRKAFRDNRPPKTGTRPTAEQRAAAIAATAAQLGVSVDTLKDLVSEYGGAPANGTATNGKKPPAPIAGIAAKLGIDVSVVQAAFDANRPPAGVTPTTAQREAIANAIGITGEQLHQIVQEIKASQS